MFSPTKHHTYVLNPVMRGGEKEPQDRGLKLGLSSNSCGMPNKGLIVYRPENIIGSFIYLSASCTKVINHVIVIVGR